MADPTPKTKGNLPRMREDDRPGHEILPRRPIEWYERADPTTPGDLRPRFTTDPQHGQRPEIVERFKKGGGEQRGFVYARGGAIEEDREEADHKLAGGRLPGMENVEEELGLPEDQRLDHLRRPGQKGYMETKPMAAADEKAPPPKPIYPPGPKGTDYYFGEKYTGPYWEKPGYDPKNQPVRPKGYEHGGMVKHGSSTCVDCHYSDGRKYK